MVLECSLGPFPYFKQRFQGLDQRQAHLWGRRCHQVRRGRSSHGRCWKLDQRCGCTQLASSSSTCASNFSLCLVKPISESLVASWFLDDEHGFLCCGIPHLFAEDILLLVWFPMINDQRFWSQINNLLYDLTWHVLLCWMMWASDPGAPYLECLLDHKWQPPWISTRSMFSYQL